MTVRHSYSKPIVKLKIIFTLKEFIMKLSGAIIGLLLFVCIANGQLVNPDFEEWNGNDPVGWFTYNFITEAVESSDNAQSGDHAARLMITEMFEVSPVMQTIGAATLEDTITLDVYYASLTEGVELNLAVAAFLNGQPVGGTDESTMDANPHYQLLALEWETMVDNVDSILVVVSLQSEEQPMIGSVLVDNVILHGVTALGVDDKPAGSAASWQLDAAYPNPFNSSTTIGFSVPDLAHVELAVYDLLGQKVITLADGIYTPGSYREIWDGSRNDGSVLPTGAYLVQLTGCKRILQTRIVLLK